MPHIKIVAYIEGYQLLSEVLEVAVFGRIGSVESVIMRVALIAFESYAVGSPMLLAQFAFDLWRESSRSEAVHMRIPEVLSLVHAI